MGEWRSPSGCIASLYLARGRTPRASVNRTPASDSATIDTAASSALSGSVKTHAVTMLPATPQRTAERRLLAPTPMMHALMQWVVDTGTPRWLAPRMTNAPLVSAANPCSGVMRMILLPIVLMMRCPPADVPRAIAAAHATMTHVGTLSEVGSIHDGNVEPFPAARNESSASVMTPIDFCASFDPCENAIRHADASCRRRDTRLTTSGATRRKSQ